MQQALDLLKVFLVSDFHVCHVSLDNINRFFGKIAQHYSAVIRSLEFRIRQSNVVCLGYHAAAKALGCLAVAEECPVGNGADAIVRINLNDSVGGIERHIHGIVLFHCRKAIVYYATADKRTDGIVEEQDVIIFIDVDCSKRGVISFLSSGNDSFYFVVSPSGYYGADSFHIVASGYYRYCINGRMILESLDGVFKDCPPVDFEKLLRDI